MEFDSLNILEYCLCLSIVKSLHLKKDPFPNNDCAFTNTIEYYICVNTIAQEFASKDPFCNDDYAFTSHLDPP